MVSHKAGTRAAKGGRGMGRCATPQGERVVETEGELLDALEEPARTSPLDPMAVLTHSVEELDCRVAELDRQMLVVAQRADMGYVARKKVDELKYSLIDTGHRLTNWLVTVGTLAFMAFCVAALAIAFHAGVI